MVAVSLDQCEITKESKESIKGLFFQKKDSDLS